MNELRESIGELDEVYQGAARKHAVANNFHLDDKSAARPLGGVFVESPVTHSSTAGC